MSEITYSNIALVVYVICQLPYLAMVVHDLAIGANHFVFDEKDEEAYWATRIIDAVNRYNFRADCYVYGGLMSLAAGAIIGSTWIVSLPALMFVGMLFLARKAVRKTRSGIAEAIAKHESEKHA